MLCWGHSTDRLCNVRPVCIFIQTRDSFGSSDRNRNCKLLVWWPRWCFHVGCSLTHHAYGNYTWMTADETNCKPQLRSRPCESANSIVFPLHCHSIGRAISPLSNDILTVKYAIRDFFTSSLDYFLGGHVCACVILTAIGWSNERQCLGGWSVHRPHFWATYIGCNRILLSMLVPLIDGIMCNQTPLHEMFSTVGFYRPILV